jgi:hypothetical protein
MRSAQKFVSENLKGRGEDNIKIDLTALGYEDVDWSRVAQDLDQ